MSPEISKIADKAPCSTKRAEQDAVANPRWATSRPRQLIRQRALAAVMRRIWELSNFTFRSSNTGGYKYKKPNLTLIVSERNPDQHSLRVD